MTIKVTKKRQQIIEVIKDAKEPLSANAIHEKLPDIDLVTIYRNLDLFAQAGVFKKLLFKDEALYEYQEQPHHHAICESCDKMIHFKMAEEKLKELIKIDGFTIDSIDVTVKGTCAHT